MKIALVHDYLTQRGGAERVFELLCKYFPDADIFTSLYDRENTIDLKERSVSTTPLQHLPGSAKYFRMLAPFYYPAFRSLDLQAYDLIISSTSSFAKGIKKSAGAKHICFCHNVTRFLWDIDTYLKEYSEYKKFYPLFEKLLQSMRKLDYKYAQEPDVYIANSSVVGRRIENIYHRKAIVVNYPIDSENFKFHPKKQNFYLVTSRMLGYKKIDVTIKAFNNLGWPLIIIGDGPEREYLESIAEKNVKFLGYVSDRKRRNLMSKASGVIVTALEDYGLVPIEANASGTPVIAYGKGGVLDTQICGITGVLFERQTPESLEKALLQAKNIKWDYTDIKNHALSNFTEKVFFDKVDVIIDYVRRNEPIARLEQKLSSQDLKVSVA
ncbi:MAG: glycosyltransferase [Prochloraceae cyanobacterium]|nr:glycosyltransferase [Prochloraceae cyanobacterium]